MEVTLYKTSKRKNSLAIPTGGVTVSVTLKGGSSLIRPTIYLNMNDDGYNMLSMNGRYYWISDWIWERNDLARISAVIDPLASWRNEILATSAYVLYSSSSYNAMIRDDRLMTPVNTRIVNASGGTPAAFDATGSYVVGVIGKPNRPSASGMTTVYSLTERQCSDLAVAFSEDDAIKQLINEYGAAWDALIFSRWLPVRVEPGETSSISIANVNTGIQGRQIEQRYLNGTTFIDIPWQYSDFRKVEPYCEAHLFLPFVGVVDISLAAISSVSRLVIRYSIDRYTGDIVYKIGNNEYLAVYSGNCAIEVPINAYQRDWKGVVQNGVSAIMSFGQALQQVPQAIMSAMAGGVPSGPSFDGAIGNFMNTVDSYFTFNTGNKGGFSGGAGLGLGLETKIAMIVHDTSTNPSNMMVLYGRPCGQVKQIGSLSGFVQTAEFKVSGTMTEQEKSMIESYMRGGVYIE